MTTKKFIVALVIVFLFVTGVGATTSYDIYIPLVISGSLPEPTETPQPVPTETPPPVQCPQDGWYLGHALSQIISISVEDCNIIYMYIGINSCDVGTVYFTSPIPIVNGEFDVTGAVYKGTLNVSGSFTDKAQGNFKLVKYDLYTCTKSGPWSASLQP